MREYPTPEQLDLPEPEEVSPDQSYYVGWLVQFNRLAVFLGVAMLANVLLIVSMFTMTSRYQPKVQYVTLEGGYPVVWNEAGNPVIDDTEYVPARLRKVVMNFIEFRYQYDYQNIQRINTALALMSEEAAREEMQKIQQLDLRTTIVGSEVKVDLDLDYSNWEVVAIGDGRFEVTVNGQAMINDVRNTDPENPLVKPVVLRLVIQTVPATDVNPLGYTVVGTGRDVL